jgi:integrase
MSLPDIATPVGPTDARGLLQKLFAAVRPEFRGDELVFDPRDPVFGGPPCRVPDCVRPDRGRGLCNAHHMRWRKAGEPDLDHFAATTDPRCRSQFGRGSVNDAVPAFECRVSLVDLGPQLRLEVQYGLQRRRAEGRVKTAPTVVARMVRLLAGLSVLSLLDLDEQACRRRFGRPAPKDRGPRSLLIYTRRQVEDLAHGTGWSVEYPRDDWRLRNLGLPTGSGAPSHLRFDKIAQDWLKELAKRWVRWRLTTGLGATAAARCVTAITRFGRFLTASHMGITRLSEVNRGVLEHYLADLHAELAGRPTHRTHIGLLNAFLQAIRQHGWDPTLPTNALFHAEDYPKDGQQAPRALGDNVMAQLEEPTNLQRWGNPAYRLVTVILMRCGLRVSDAVKLAFDCLTLDADAAPYLRYRNHKMKREALVPIDEQLHQLITDQQRRILRQWPAATPVLFPRPFANPDGQLPIGAGTYRDALYRWLHRCDIRDEHGQPVHLTPHQWRHTLGTRLINRDVPQEVVRRILDHDSHAMTAHYARLHDSTVRRHWEQARKVNIDGGAVNLDPDGPLADAAWAKQRLGRATQALPNGYCGLPIQKSCPHANACLTCPMFITTAEFLPQHRSHRQQVLQIITAAEARGQTRLAQMNQQVADNLQKVIAALEDDHGQPQAVADAS